MWGNKKKMYEFLKVLSFLIIQINVKLICHNINFTRGANKVVFNGGWFQRIIVSAGGGGGVVVNVYYTL